jgi:hypothetical protein
MAVQHAPEPTDQSGDLGVRSAHGGGRLLATEHGDVALDMSVDGHGLAWLHEQ